MIIRFLLFAVLIGSVNLLNNISNQFIFTNTLAALYRQLFRQRTIISSKASESNQPGGHLPASRSGLDCRKY